MIIDAHQTVLPDGTLAPARVWIDGDQIVAVKQGERPHPQPVTKVSDREADVVITDGVLAPGLVDTHVHGGGGASLASTDPNQIRQACQFHLDHGTTSIIASMVTDELATIEAQLAVLAGLSRSGEIAGIHLETPFLSAAKCGAHPPDLLLAPDPRIAERLLNASDGELSMITIAPELPGALPVIEQFVAAGVRVAIGHTAGNLADTRAAIEAGATVATHLFNAMLPIHHRDPGPIPLLLTDPRVAVELICDGMHLAPEIVATAIAAAGVQRTMLITDAMSAAGLGDGLYQLGKEAVSVRNGQANLISDDGQLGSIAGSTLTLDRAVRFVLDHTPASVVEAVVMASTTPARVHGLDRVGRIAPGCRADLIVLDPAAQIRGVMRAGRWHRAPLEVTE